MLDTTLGGKLDPGRFTPMPVQAQVLSLSNVRARLETTRSGIDAGPTAVLRFGTFTVVVLSRTVALFDRAVYFANGLDPRHFDLVIVKSPHTAYDMYDAWVERTMNVDAPGSTSANLPTLGHTVCRRPIFPLDPGVAFAPAAEVHRRRARS